MRRLLRVTLWGFLYWFAGAWWLARYFDPDQLHLITGDLVLWALICLGIEATRREVVQ